MTSVAETGKGTRKKSASKMAVDADTKTRLIHAATALFSTKGIDGVSTRDITSAAKANSAAIGYHFGSKDNLVREVFSALAAPMNRTRLDALTQYEASVPADAQLDIEQVARCLIEPALRSASDPGHDAHALSRLLLLARTLPGPWVTNVLAEQYDEVFNRFISAFSRALPELDRETICWRYDFLVGSLLYASSYYYGQSRIARITEGKCDPADVDNVIDQLVHFAGGAMRCGAIGR